MKTSLIISSAIIFSTVLTSCSSNIKVSWSCPVLEGGKGNCASISDADSAIKSSSENNISLPESYSTNKQKIEITLFAPKLKDLEKLANDNKLKSQSKLTQTIQDISISGSSSAINKPITIPQTSNPQNRLRTEEKVGKVWFLPYIDSDGNQHSESAVYIIDEKPRWISQR